MGNGLFIYRAVHTICRGFSIELDNSGISGTVEKSTSLVTLGSVADPHDLVTDCVRTTDPLDAYTPLQILPLLYLDPLLFDRTTLHTSTSRKKHHATGNPACRHHSDLLQSTGKPLARNHLSAPAGRFYSLSDCTVQLIKIIQGTIEQQLKAPHSKGKNPVTRCHSFPRYAPQSELYNSRARTYS